MLAPWKKSYDPPRQHIKKQDITLPTKVRLVKAMVFPGVMYGCWELDHKESWVQKSLCFWAVVLEKTLESPFECKEIQPVNPEGNQPWMFIVKTDAKAETPILWLPDTKNWFIGKDPDAGKGWRQEEKVTTDDEMVGWHHQLDGYEFGQALRVIGDGQGTLACCSPWGCKDSDTTEQLNWTDIWFTLLVSGIQQSESVVHTHIPTLF